MRTVDVVENCNINMIVFVFLCNSSKNNKKRRQRNHNNTSGKLCRDFNHIVRRVKQRGTSTKCRWRFLNKSNEGSIQAKEADGLRAERLLTHSRFVLFAILFHHHGNGGGIFGLYVFFSVGGAHKGNRRHSSRNRQNAKGCTIVGDFLLFVGKLHYAFKVCLVAVRGCCKRLLRLLFTIDLCVVSQLLSSCLNQMLDFVWFVFSNFVCFVLFCGFVLLSRGVSFFF